jgi:hypothetical protein
MTGCLPIKVELEHRRLPRLEQAASIGLQIRNHDLQELKTLALRSPVHIVRLSFQCVICPVCRSIRQTLAVQLLLFLFLRRPAWGGSCDTCCCFSLMPS